MSEDVSVASDGIAGRVRGRLFDSLSFQLFAGLVVVALIPALLRWDTQVFTAPTNGEAASLVAVGLAFMAALFALRRVQFFPGFRGSIYIVPLATVIFSLVIVIMFFFRVEFSRYVLLAGYGLSIGWLYFLYGYSASMRNHRFAVVPFGQCDEILSQTWLRYSPLATPKFDAARHDAVIADLRAEMPVAWERLLAECTIHRIPVYHVKQVFESVSGRVSIQHLSENNLGSLLPSPVYEVVKRAMDLAVVVLFAPMLLMALLLAALAIRLDSSGPIFFVQQRMGFRGRPFAMYKFRTMRANCGGRRFTSADDERITRVGRFLRRYRLDELPQVLNILRGEMSWIGPRPEALELSRWYEREVAFYRYRHIVRPGISGWAQVNQGYAAEIDGADEKLQYDFYYVKNFSFWIDLLIALKTVRIVVAGAEYHPPPPGN